MERPIPYNGNEPFIFVSYSHKDNAAVWPIISRMIADGYRVWYDDGINPGTSWDEFIANKIKECDYFIAFLSENYIASENCKDELNYARDQVDNKLLMYLSNVSLPTGMDMRLGRVQAIHVYEFQNINHLMVKLYTSKNLSMFMNRRAEAPSFRNDVSDDRTEIFEIGSEPEGTARSNDLPMHVPVRKKTNVKFIILAVIAAIIAVALILVAIYFIDDFIFFVGKYNGFSKAIKSMTIVAISVISLIIEIIVFIRLRRKFIQ